MTNYEQYLLSINAVFFDRPDVMSKLMNAFSSVEEFKNNWECFFNQHNIVLKSKDIVAGRIKNVYVDDIVRTMERLDIFPVFISSELYPPILKQIFLLPPVLFCKGDVSLLQKDMLAFVGPRDMSEYGAQVAQTLASELSDYFIIVSGMAKGIDAVAHRAALDNGCPTVAVLGCAVDVVYPQSNSSLYDQIGEKGLLISEYPPGVGALAHRFPLRNRIVSGLSKGVVICEAGMKSGSLITARYAVEQNREVFAVPGSVFSETTQGVHRLIQDGAKLVMSTKDVLEEFGMAVVGHTQPLFSTYSDVKVVDKKPKVQHQFTEDEQKIWDVLSKEPCSVDEIMNETLMLISEVLQLLMVMEMKGVIEQVGEQKYVRV